jgi:hypothetical protein
MKPEFKTRLRIVSFFLLAFAFVLVGKLYLLQIVHGQDFAELREPFLTEGLFIFKIRTDLLYPELHLSLDL